MRRYVPLLIAGAALIAAACSDVVAPTRPSAKALLATLGGGPNSFALLVAPGEGSDAVVTTFVIDPAGSSATVGGFTLEFGADAVCDPETSGYGPTYWRESCDALGAPLTITATAFSADGRNYLEFSPDIRFNPASSVTVSTTRPDIAGQSLTLEAIVKYGIWYQTRIGDTRYFIDEAWADPELATQFDVNTGRVWRKIRHFSGVVIRTGFCEENPMDPSCEEPGGQ